MDVVADAIDAQHPALAAHDYGADVSIQLVTGHIRNGHFTTKRVDNNMKQRTDCAHDKPYD